MSNSKSAIRASKFMAFVLRHDPGAANIVLDREGWASVRDLLRAMNDNGHAVTIDDLAAIVTSDNKGRYSFSSDGRRIRANQGHSTEDVELTFEEAVPPDLLYHGTVASALDGILSNGLLPMSRHHVHLSADVETAKCVGGRRGKPIVLLVQAIEMAADGHVFYRSTNGVWLTDKVPTIYLAVMHP